MIRDFKMIRERMNELLGNIDTSSGNLHAIGESVMSTIKSGFSLLNSESKSTGIYAYTPLITATCPSELGTTSDQCSSRCGVGNCSSRRPDGQDVENPPVPVTPVMGRMSFNPWAGLSLETTNPF